MRRPRTSEASRGAMARGTAIHNAIYDELSCKGPVVHLPGQTKSLSEIFMDLQLVVLHREFNPSYLPDKQHQAVGVRGERRIDIVARFVGGPHKGKVCLVELKSGYKKLFTRLTWRKQLTQKKHRTQLTDYKLLWNNGPNKPWLGALGPCYLIYLEVAEGLIVVV